MSLQVELLEQSFGKIAPQADEFVMSFYDNLFTDYPAAKPLFEHSDMKKQGQMLKGGLVMVIENLRNPDVLSKALGGLGARHVKYGALPEHYPLVGNSLLKTFDQYLKDDWTEETKTAWVEAYGAITALMLEGADYSSEDVELESAPAAATAPAPEEEEGLKVNLLEESFGKVAPQADEFVMSFYDNLFTDYPAAKPLFEHTNMKSQGQMLKGGLVMVVENLRNPDVLTKALGGLGARHVKYGALPEHYPLVGNSLLKTFEQYLKDDWTEETKAAWVEAYGAITALMLEGADYSSEDIDLENAPPAAEQAGAPAAEPAEAVEESQDEGGLNVSLLEESFGKVAPKADEFVMSFYDNLFTDYPAAKPLFEHTNMKSQGQMLKGGLVMVVENLRHPDVLSKALGGLGARHVKYGALPEHYPLVGNSLLKTFEQYLGDDWTEETKAAWVEAYGAITTLMLDGADYSSEEVALENAPSATEQAATPVAAPAAAPVDAVEESQDEGGLNVSLLEESFGKVAPKADEFVMSFYDNLFTDYPAAKPLFEHTNMKSQGQMLKGGLVMVVENLRKPEVLSKALSGLGARHVKYGALPEHYPLVGNSLLKTFEQYLGDDWTEATKAAWVEAYGAITALMLEGADYSQQDVQLESAPAAATTTAAPNPASADPSLPTLDAPAPDPAPTPEPVSPSGGALESEASPEEASGFPALPVAGGVLGLIGVILLFILL